jgi:uncharacterized protein (DUF3820 family)|tara:strand:- start:479 stop:670 length:192 start_codon:yes stop_codon:yes gene_type:complete
MTIDHTMPFGKHEGRKIDELARMELRYCLWVLALPHFGARHPDIYRFMAMAVGEEIIKREGYL